MKKNKIKRSDIPPPIVTEEEGDKLIELAKLFIDDSNDGLTVGEVREKAFKIISEKELTALKARLEAIEEEDELDAI